MSQILDFYRNSESYAEMLQNPSKELFTPYVNLFNFAPCQLVANQGLLIELQILKILLEKFTCNQYAHHCSHTHLSPPERSSSLP